MLPLRLMNLMENTDKTDLIATYILPFATLVLPIIAAAVAWIANDWRRRAGEKYQRKEANYRELLRAMRGFYVASESNDLKKAFLEQLNLCWLYCPDDIIKKANTLMDKIAKSENGKELAAGDFVLAVRKDLFSKKVFRRTRLKPDEFRILVTREEQLAMNSASNNAINLTANQQAS